MAYTHHKGVSVTQEGLAQGGSGSEQVVFGDVFNTTQVFDAGSIADGDEQAVDIAVVGAVLGDFVLISFSIDILDITLTAQVTAADTVTALFANNTGAGIDLASGTIAVRVFSLAAGS